MKVELSGYELQVVLQSLQLKHASLERARKNLSGSLQIAYDHEANQVQAILVRLKGLPSDEAKKG